MTDRAKQLSNIAIGVLAVSLLAFGLYGLYREQAPKVTDVHAIIVAVGLVLLVPSQLASGIKTAGFAVIEVFKAKNDAEKKP